MEAVWLLAGIVLGAGVGYLVGARNPPLSQALPQPKRSIDYDDREIARLEVEERLEKLDRMIDRYRKRAAADGSRPMAEPAIEPGVNLGLDPKAALRRKARESGLLVSPLEGLRSRESGVERDASG